MAGDLVGSYLGPYLIEELIGRGGMGEVYLATHSRLERRVALKVLPPDMSHDETFRARFLRESQLAARLDHPNVVSVYDADEADGRLYIVMRYVKGTDLSHLLSAESPLDVQRGLSILRQVADALDAAHAVGLVHRDVKPANVLVAEPDPQQPYERCFLTDFGLTRLAGGGASTEYGTLVGTLEYVSPEQINGAELDARSDVYSFGCLAFEVLTGARPFIRNNAAALLNDHLNTPPPKPSSHRAELGSGVDEVLGYAMAKRPDKRYASAGEFIAALAAVVPMPVEEEAAPVATRSESKRNLVWMGAAGLALVGLIAFLAVRRTDSPAASSSPLPSLTAFVEPRPVGGLVAVGAEFSCATTVASRVMCWGSPTDAVLGRSGSSRTPDEVQGLSDVSKVAAGDSHACALVRTDGSVWCWGDNEVGQLSRPPRTLNESTTPLRIADIPPAKDLVAGRAHTCAIATAGTLHCWGWDHFGQSSGSKSATRTLDGNVPDLNQVRRSVYTFRAGPAIPGFSDVTQAAAGYEFTCVRAAGGVWCWGLNIYGRVRARDSSPPPNSFQRLTDYAIFDPARVEGIESASQLASAFGHICVAEPNDVACWGGDSESTKGRDGRLGALVRDGFGRTAVSGRESLHAGQEINCVIRSLQLMCWGRADSALLKPGTKVESLTHIAIGQVVDASIGLNHACAALLSGEVMCWGSNAQGQLGTGGSPTQFVRVPGVTARTSGAPSTGPSPT